MGVDGPFDASLSSRRAICAGEKSAVFSALTKNVVIFRLTPKALIFLDSTPGFAQIELIKGVANYVAMHNVGPGVKRRGQFGEVDYGRSKFIPC
jgi:hypothetical protein